MANPIPTRTYLQPVPYPRAGCPCIITNASEQTYLNGTVRRVTEMVLQNHLGQDIPLNSLHRDLETSHLLLHNSGSENICLSRIGFSCEIILPQGPLVTSYPSVTRYLTVTPYLSFDLKIPGDRVNVVFSSDLMLQAYQTQQALFAAIGQQHGVGHVIANPNNFTHGNTPDYVSPNIGVPLNQSFVLHTEQMLVAYLARMDAAEMLKNRLKIFIRGEYGNAITAKVHAIGIHLNQNKTCCGPCEYSLIGLMQNTQQGLIPNLGAVFNPQVQAAQPILTPPDDTLNLQMIVPQNPNPFPMVTTVAAKEYDATHRHLPTFNPTQPQPIQPPIFRSIIDLRLPTTSQHIYTTILSPHDPAVLAHAAAYTTAETKAAEALAANARAITASTTPTGRVANNPTSRRTATEAIQATAASNAAALAAVGAPGPSFSYEGSVAISGSLTTGGTRGTRNATETHRDSFLDYSTAGIARLFQ